MMEKPVVEILLAKEASFSFPENPKLQLRARITIEHHLHNTNQIVQ